MKSLVRLVMTLALSAQAAAHARPDSISEPVTFERIASFLRAHPRVRTIDALLGRLPETFRSQYTLMHASQSSQGATPEFPRAIVYGRDARTVIAFNGDVSQKGFFQLEIIQWRQKQRAFEFREIAFPAPSQKRGRVKISDANPSKCLTCHRKDPRPNWEPYAEWPGAYAGNDDTLALDGEPLVRELESFVARAPKHPRYSHLPFLAEGYFEPNYPAGNPRQTRTMVKHNIRLSFAFNQMNYRRMARLMEATKDFKKYRYAVMGILAGCGHEVASYFPEDESEETPTTFSEPIHSENRAESLLALFETRGIATKDWGTSFGNNERRFTSPDVWAAELLANLVDGQPDIAKLFWRFEGYYGARHASALQDDEEKTCGAMREASLAAFK